AAAQLMPGEAHAFAMLAQAHQAQRQSDQALAQINRAIQLKPDDATYYYHRGLIERELKQETAAFNDFGKATSLLEKRVLSTNEKTMLRDCHLERGKILRTQGNREEALKEFQAAVDVVRDSPQTHRWIGEILLELNRPKEALRELDEFVRL